MDAQPVSASQCDLAARVLTRLVASKIDVDHIQPIYIRVLHILTHENTVHLFAWWRFWRARMLNGLSRNKGLQKAILSVISTTIKSRPQLVYDTMDQLLESLAQVTTVKVGRSWCVGYERPCI
jgi:hypothetical protein